MENQNYLTLREVCARYEALGKLLDTHGQFKGALWVRTLKTRKGVASVITKETRTVVRAGLDYDNRAKVKDARESGELPAENAGLPWGEWLAFPHLITHKGNIYVRLYPVENHIPKVIYRINGQLARREEVEPLCLASEFGEVRADIGCMTLNIANLRRVR